MTGDSTKSTSRLVQWINSKTTTFHPMLIWCSVTPLLAIFNFQIKKIAKSCFWLAYSTIHQKIKNMLTFSLKVHTNSRLSLYVQVMLKTFLKRSNTMWSLFSILPVRRMREKRRISRYIPNRLRIRKKYSLHFTTGYVGINGTHTSFFYYSFHIALCPLQVLSEDSPDSLPGGGPKPLILKGMYYY